MKNISVIKDRNSGMETTYVLAGKNIAIAGLGTYRELLFRLWDNTVDKEFKLAAITPGFIYYLDENESDDTACVVMLNSHMELVSDNFFAANDLIEIVTENKEMKWCSPVVRQWQQEQNGDDFVNL